MKEVEAEKVQVKEKIETEEINVGEGGIKMKGEDGSCYEIRVGAEEKLILEKVECEELENRFLPEE